MSPSPYGDSPYNTITENQRVLCLIESVRRHSEEAVARARFAEAVAGLAVLVSLLSLTLAIVAIFIAKGVIG